MNALRAANLSTYKSNRERHRDVCVARRVPTGNTRVVQGVEVELAERVRVWILSRRGLNLWGISITKNSRV
jgi:hypothetical protein